jgi:hypothetical protein
VDRVEAEIIENLNVGLACHVCVAKIVLDVVGCHRQPVRNAPIESR